jgi:predicted nucleotidyltransferase component of viral defense system
MLLTGDAVMFKGALIVNRLRFSNHTRFETQ